ncbi:MAG: hypothetical protein P0Y55_12020 [Candidatus Cohnella colombiensis]|uniref:Uncharacterized protein n=1 Tax=Candidatus Cohnella colombiensis TaxID=3121368 RepID=A0AA95EXU5_9BACL|nr:MAG: hypothetical protein P0Y55_12020 [Cohnella sp.]
MAVSAKRLAQSALSATVTARYTAGAGVTAQITEIWLANTGTTDRIVSLYQGGTATTNMIATGVKVPNGGSVCLGDLKIVVAATQVLAAKQDVGTDITMTLFGVEEA